MVMSQYTVRSVKLNGSQELLSTPEKVTASSPIDAARAIVKGLYTVSNKNVMFKVSVQTSKSETFTVDIYKMKVEHVPPTTGTEKGVKTKNERTTDKKEKKMGRPMKM